MSLNCIPAASRVEYAHMANKLGCAPVAAIIVLILFAVFFGANEGVGFYYSECDNDENFISCLLDEMMSEDEEAEPAEGTVTAVGAYEYKGYAVTITLSVPLNGGAVNGTVSGTCEGPIKGSYAGGAITGNMSGVCAPFFVSIPASAEFTGSVNKSAKTVPVSFNGRGGGLSHEGSTTLTYP